MFNHSWNPAGIIRESCEEKRDKEQREEAGFFLGRKKEILQPKEHNVAAWHQQPQYNIQNQHEPSVSFYTEATTDEGKLHILCSASCQCSTDCQTASSTRLEGCWTHYQTPPLDWNAPVTQGPKINIFIHIHIWYYWLPPAYRHLEGVTI